MEYGVLGPLEVRDGEQSVPLAGAKQRALLALLLLSANRVVSRERLIDELWGEEPPATAVTTVQVYVSRLRKVLPAETLQTRSPGYVLEVEPEQLDLLRFERLLEIAREADPESASLLLREALALWRGPALAEFDEPFARIEGARLEELRFAALEERIDTDLALSRHAELVGELQTLIAARPHRERLRRQLILALYRSGRQADALEAYRAAHNALDEIGLEPSEQLRELERAILTHDAALAPARRKTNLSPPPTPLIGRTRELAELLRLIRKNELVTVTGAGGSGKTRLAVAAAHELLADFAEGVWFVSLAFITDPALVEPAIADVLGVRADLHAFLRGRQLLLVLDNLEQLLPDVAPTIASLEASVLATSRERLNLRAEQEYSVPALRREDAIVLFTECARRLEPSFEPDDGVAEIVHRLDGLPLAIELAAARVKILTPREIAAHLGEGLDLLVGGARDAPERQRTLRATLEWSYKLLRETERNAFSRLGVFVGGFDRVAAEAVASVRLDVLGSLTDKNLVGRDANGRFFLLELIRQFAHELLDCDPEAEALRRRHAEYYVTFAIRASEERFLAPDEAALDSGNLLAAADWARVRGELELLVEAADVGYEMRIRPETASVWLEAALAPPDGLEPALHLRALIRAAIVRQALGEYTLSRSLAEQALVEARALADEQAEMQALRVLGMTATLLGDLHSARGMFEQGIALTERRGDTESMIRFLNVGGESERRMGDLEDARALFERAVALVPHSPNRRKVASYVLHGLADVELLAGELDRAARHYREALVELGSMPDERLAVHPVAGLAAVAAAEGETERAGTLWGVAAAFERDVGLRLDEFERHDYETTLDQVAGPAFQLGFERGTTMTYDQAVAYALGSG